MLGGKGIGQAVMAVFIEMTLPGAVEKAGSSAYQCGVRVGAKLPAKNQIADIDLPPKAVSG